MSEGTLIWGGREVAVRHRDGRAETVRVRQLTVRELEGYLPLYGDEAARIEYACGQPKGWADDLEPAAHEALVAVDQELNLDFFSRWRRRRMEAVALLADPAQVDLTREALQAAFVELLAPMGAAAKELSRRLLADSTASSAMPAPPSAGPGA